MKEMPVFAVFGGIEITKMEESRECTRRNPHFCSTFTPFLLHVYSTFTPFSHHSPLLYSTFTLVFTIRQPQPQLDSQGCV